MWCPLSQWLCIFYLFQSTDYVFLIICSDQVLGALNFFLGPLYKNFGLENTSRIAKRVDSCRIGEL